MRCARAQAILYDADEASDDLLTAALDHIDQCDHGTCPAKLLDAEFLQTGLMIQKISKLAPISEKEDKPSS